MISYILKRLALAAAALLVIVSLCFFAIRLMPGSPFDDPDLSPAMQQLMEEKYHLHESLPRQYYFYLKDILTEGYWGVSLKLEPQVPVWQVLRSRIPVSLVMNLLALLLALPLGILAGTAAALHRSRFPDHLISLLVVLGISVPSFVFASCLQYFCGYKLGAFSLVYNSLGTPGEKLFSLILPILALSFGPIATVCRYLRGELAEQLSSDYLLLARAKGLSRLQSIVRHAFRNAAVPLLSVTMPMFASVLSGSLVVETVFAVPGVGGILTRSIQNNDYWLTVAALVFYSLVSLITGLLTDLAYVLVDPRIRLKGGQHG